MLVCGENTCQLTCVQSGQPCSMEIRCCTRRGKFNVQYAKTTDTFAKLVEVVHTLVARWFRSVERALCAGDIYMFVCVYVHSVSVSVRCTHAVIRGQNYAC